jgi:hypothetical protein
MESKQGEDTGVNDVLKQVRRQPALTLRDDVFALGDLLQKHGVHHNAQLLRIKILERDRRLREAHNQP